MKKKICFVVASPFTAQVFLKNHVNALAEFFEVYFVANFEGYEHTKMDGFNFTSIKDIPLERGIHPIKDLKALYLLRKYLKESKFDAVHTVTPKAGLLGMTAAKYAGIHTRIHIFTGQVWHTQTGWFRKMLIYMDRKIVANATHILVDGKSQRQFLIDNKILKETNSQVLGRGSISGVDASRFVHDESLKMQVRNELGIKKDEIVFMFLGRMNRDKGILDLGRAFDQLSKQKSNCKLLLVGIDEGGMIPMLQEIILDKSKVINYGVTAEPERLLQAGDVFCLPSYREGFGTSVIEASLMEKAVICSDTYGLKETIIDGETGLRHKVKDVNELYEKMLALANDEELRNRLGKNGRKYVLDNFTAKAITDEWVKFYKSILGV